MAVAAHPPDRDAIDEIHMSPHELRKSVFGVVLRVAAQQFGVFEHGYIYSSRSGAIRTKKAPKLAAGCVPRFGVN